MHVVAVAAVPNDLDSECALLSLLPLHLASSSPPRPQRVSPVDDLCAWVAPLRSLSVAVYIVPVECARVVSWGAPFWRARQSVLLSLRTHEVCTGARLTHAWVSSTDGLHVPNVPSSCSMHGLACEGEHTPVVMWSMYRGVLLIHARVIGC